MKITYIKRYIRSFSLCLVSLFFIIGCGEDSATEPAPTEPVLNVTFITSVGGTGDNGYNDLVLSGIMHYYHNHQDDVRLSMRRPSDEEEVRNFIKKWAEAENGQESRSLLILASSEYEDILKAAHPSLNDNQRILLFESDGKGLPDGVATFRIGRYGAAALAGMMAGESPEAYVVSACRGNRILSDAEQGFADGYRRATQGNTPIVEYLSDTESGFSMPEKAYDIVKDLEEAFIFPLAGGSNNGIYRYSREDYFTLQLVAGMDVDCSELSTRIPFSIITHIDGILLALLEEWHKSGIIPAYREYCMGEGVELKVNPFFLERANIFLDYYADPAYWEMQKEKWTSTAKEMERIYYEK